MVGATIPERTLTVKSPEALAIGIATADTTTPRPSAADIDLRNRLFIDGRFVDPIAGGRFTSENPATGRPLIEVAEGTADDVDVAVRAARRAVEHGPWATLAPGERKRVLLAVADAIDAHTEELALIESLDAGKPIEDCRTIDIPDTASTIRWHAEAIDKLNDEVTPTGRDALAMVVREPVGVVGAVIPWNYPALMAAWKLGPALATGNAVVIKPASYTALSLLRIAEIATEAGLPEGVLNVVTGGGSTVGGAIGRHPDIDAVAFTGSTEVGRDFLRYAAESNLKRVLLELGGKSPQLVMRDVSDLDNLVANAANAIFWNMGENCSAGSRLIVHRDRAREVVDRLVAHVEREWIVGDPMDPATRIGALISRDHLGRVLDYVSAGRSEGARVVTGGSRTREDSGGWFIQPTIFDGVTNEMRIAREEIFGPVLAVLEFRTEAEAIAIANDTPYGLAASLYTDDLNVAHRVSRALKAGTVGVNCYSEGDMTTPFGGYKQSGFGGHDKSLHAHDQYTETKTIWIQLRTEADPATDAP
jgi:gamma-glutamyl-gamma-aminobutyraldehyde dehydrogenase